MRAISKAELEEILYKHRLWLRGESGGVRADLSYVDFTNADIAYANLRYANLRCAELDGANLMHSNLEYADFRGANLNMVNFGDAILTDVNFRYAKLYGADFRCAYLDGADFTCTDLRYVNFTDAYLYKTVLRSASLDGAKLNGANLMYADLEYAYLGNAKLDGVKNIFFPMACPEKGSFIAFKKVGDYIIELFIPEDAKRSSATTRKCRCNKAKVISITTLSGNETNITGVYSDYDPNFIYKLGEYVEVKDFNENRWNECSTGIHFFISRQEAVNY